MRRNRNWPMEGLALGFAAGLFLATGAGAAEPRATLVAIRHLEPVDYDVTLPDKLGVLEAGDHRVLGFEIAGRLEWVAREGQTVGSGDEIARLEAALERTRVKQAELRLRDARSHLTRTEGLKRSHAASEKAHEDALVAVDLRAAELDTAREQLAIKTLRTPFAGVVAETRFDPGEVVSPGKPIATLMQLAALELSVGVPGYQVGRVRQDAETVVTVPALPGERFDGSVRHVAPAAMEGRHLFEVDVLVPNPEGRLRPGMSARAAIVTRTLAGVFVAPLEAVVERAGRRTVFRVEGGVARAIDVSDAPLHGDHVLVQLPPEDRPGIDLVVRGQHGLRDGMAVRVDNSVLGAAPRAFPRAHALARR